MKTLVRPLFVVVLLLLVVGGHHVWAVDSYVSEVQKWRADYTRDLLGPDGPFTLVARLFPTRGMSSVGRDPANALVLPVELAPLRAGTIEWSGGKNASFRVEPGVAALVNGKAVSEIQISQPVIVAIGDLRLRFGFSSESQLRIGVLDLNARMRKAATPSVWFPIDARYRIAADWIPFPEPKMVRIADNDGGSREWKNPGYGSFMIDGKTVTLQGVLSPDGKQMAFFFRDQTAGSETYGAGRFVDVDLPKNGKVIIDFNKAYNPSCAFNTLFVCPIPPRENHLPIRIAAGERNYPHQGEVH